LSSLESQVSLLRSVVLRPLNEVNFSYFSVFSFFTFVVVHFCFFFYLSSLYFIFFSLVNCVVCSQSKVLELLRKRTIAPHGAIVCKTLLNNVVATKEANDRTTLGDHSLSRHAPEGIQSPLAHART
jgi:hypothetical protein